EGVSGGTGEAGQHGAAGQWADLARVRLDDSLAETDLAIAGDDHPAALAYGKDRGAVPDGLVAIGHGGLLSLRVDGRSQTPVETSRACWAARSFGQDAACPWPGALQLLHKPRSDHSSKESADARGQRRAQYQGNPHLRRAQPRRHGHL